MSSEHRMCIIGAGASGLCAARHIIKINEFTSATSKLTPVIYEYTDCVGGTWVYNEDTGSEIHSSMYKNLYTNLPKEVMAFPDYPFPPSSNSYLHHTEISKYLEDYATNFNLKKYVQFRTKVQLVKPMKLEKYPNERNGKWLVNTTDLESGVTETNEFVGVMVCNGHYSVPFSPDISGLKQTFKGTVSHSHDYRDVTPFVNKVTLVLGASNSGQDIGIEISSVAKQVLLSHNNKHLSSPLPKNIKQVSGVLRCIDRNSFLLNDGSQVNEVDILLFCTGYKYSYPFLHESCNISIVEHMVVKPLYKHTININHPTMCFIGIPSLIVPFPQFHLQVQLYLRYFAKLIELPNKEGMMLELNDEAESMNMEGKPLRHFHKMGTKQWGYNQDLAAVAKVENVPSYVEKLFNEVLQRRYNDQVNYKKDTFLWINNEYKRRE